MVDRHITTNHDEGTAGEVWSNLDAAAWAIEMKAVHAFKVQQGFVPMMLIMQHPATAEVFTVPMAVISREKFPAVAEMLRKMANQIEGM